MDIVGFAKFMNLNCHRKFYRFPRDRCKFDNFILTLIINNKKFIVQFINVINATLVHSH